MINKLLFNRQLRVGRYFIELYSKNLSTSNWSELSPSLDDVTIILCGKAVAPQPLLDVIKDIRKKTGIKIIASSRSTEEDIYYENNKDLEYITIAPEVLERLPKGRHTENMQIKEMQLLMKGVKTKYTLRLRKDLSCSYQGLLNFIVMARGAMALKRFVVSSLSSCPLVDFCISDILVFGETQIIHELYGCPFRDIETEPDVDATRYENAESWLWGHYFEKMQMMEDRDLLKKAVYVVDTAKYDIYFARESIFYLDKYIEYMTDPWLLLLTRMVIPRHYHATQMSCICGHEIIAEAYRNKGARVVSKKSGFRRVVCILRRRVQNMRTERALF